MRKAAEQRVRWPGKPVPRSFFERPSTTVAPQLLNKILACADGRSGRIVEVEAYRGSLDPAAHTFRGKTPRTEVMFGPAGHMYVYFTYGMHWCCNCVCRPVGEGVLIRALEPLHGLDQMRDARSVGTKDRDLCRGPARLAQALGITGVQNGVDLVKGRDGFAIVDDGVAAPEGIMGTRRVGISVGVESPWRWSVPDSRYVSGPVVVRS